MESRKLRRVTVGLIAVSAVGCGGGSGPHGRRAGVAAVIKGLDNPFFVTMKDGLVSAARQDGVPITVQAAVGLQDTAGQASTLGFLASRQAACYVVNPINGTNLIPPLAQIPEGTPIVNIDAPVARQAAQAVGVSITTYIGTDNVAAGRMAAAAMARFVAHGAGVAVIAGIPGDATSGARTRGFIEGSRGRFHVILTVAADFDRRRATLATAETLRRRTSIAGFFAVNDEMALGTADAVRAAGRTGKVAVIGVDGISAALDAVKHGVMSATIAQYPYTIGQLAVEACLAATRRKALPGKIDAPIQTVTLGNVALAQLKSPRPAQPFTDPLFPLLHG